MITVEQITDAQAKQAVRDAHEAYAQGGKYNDFMESLYSQMARKNGALSEKQLAAIKRGMVKRAEFAAERAAEDAKFADAEDVPEGHAQTITGEILSCKFKHSDFGGAYKIVVRDDRGFKIYGTLPRRIEEMFESFRYDADQALDESVSQEAKGKRITFVAQTEQSKDDTKFGFFKRPRQAVLLEAVAA